MFKLIIALILVSFQNITADITNGTEIVVSSQNITADITNGTEPVVSVQNITADVTNGTELVMSFLVHRHGDRTPIKASMPYSTNREVLEMLSMPYGYGQLTVKGKQRGYQLGKYIRTRYSELLAAKYNHSEVYIHSTDSTRTKMTILTALAAIYPPNGDAWSDELNWEPVPYTTEPMKYDFNAAFLSCPTFRKGYEDLLNTSSPLMSVTYEKALNTLSRQVGYNVSQMPARVYLIYDTYTTQISLGLPVDPEVEEIWQEVVAAAGAAIDLVFGSEQYIALQAGVLLNEFYEHSAKVIAGKDTQRLRIYSAHDFNVYSFEAVTQITPRQGVPKYASAYSLEVRKVTATGQYVVLPVYLPEPGRKEIYLQVKGCDVLCDYGRFLEITKKYSLNITSWRTKCKFTEDIAKDHADYD